MSAAPLKRTGELRSAEQLAALVGQHITPRQIKVPAPAGVFFKVRKSSPPRWRFYRESKP